MADLIYKITFFSDWHCGSGLSSGTDADLLPITDKDGFPFVPGKTIKGLLRDAGETLSSHEIISEHAVHTLFGKRSKEKTDKNEAEDSVAGKALFSNAGLTKAVKKSCKNPDILFRTLSSTAIEKSGLARAHFLRTIAVTVPLTLFGKISDVPEELKSDTEKCLKFVKRMGSGRTRGFGRCRISLEKEV